MNLKKLLNITLAGAIGAFSLHGMAAVNVDRSLLVHDTATLNNANFSLERVMSQLAAQMSATNPNDPVTAFQLFARMWDAQRPTGALPQTGVSQCNGSVNSFSISCRPAEGSQAADPVRFMFEYRPIALVNRFDLRNKTNLADCGEYRIIFANMVTQRNFIIFEAELPNPTPGVASGCTPIQRLWEGLTTNNSAASRSNILANFYFNGLPAQNVRPVIDARNYALNTGQIRTNQFMTPPWVLKEYKTAIQNGRNTLQVVSVKSNPVGKLFSVTNADPRAATFQTNFVAGVTSLLGANLNKISLNVTNNAHNNGQSHAQANTENNFWLNFQPSLGSAFENNIKNKITAAGSVLTVQQVINRASAMTCGGCHQPAGFGLTAANAIGPGQTWPNSLNFVHVSETAVNGIFPLSPALTSLFLPARKADMESFLANQAAALAAPALLLQAAPSDDTATPEDLPSTDTSVTTKSKRSG